VASEPELKLGSWRCYSEHGYYYVAGRVTNISDASLDNVTAVATFETKDGLFAKNDQYFGGRASINVTGSRRSSLALSSSRVMVLVMAWSPEWRPGKAG
jgi:hypothetical protein